MVSATDYDAPRRSASEDEADAQSIDALRAARTEAQSPIVDEDDADTGESIDLPVLNHAGPTEAAR